MKERNKEKGEHLALSGAVNRQYDLSHQSEEGKSEDDAVSS